MEDYKNVRFGFFALIIILIFFIWSWYSRGQEIDRLNSALNDANERIGVMDTQISSAKGILSAWKESWASNGKIYGIDSSLDELRNAIDNLEPSSPVSAP